MRKRFSSYEDELRRELSALGQRLNVVVSYPRPAFCTDNAAMIAAAAFPKYQRGEFADFSLAAQANLTLAG